MSPFFTVFFIAGLPLENSKVPIFKFHNFNFIRTASREIKETSEAISNSETSEPSTPDKTAEIS